MSLVVTKPLSNEAISLQPQAEIISLIDIRQQIDTSVIYAQASERKRVNEHV